MNFDLNDASVLLEQDFQNEETFQAKSPAKFNESIKSTTGPKNASAENSLILKELFDEVDQLREKIKLNQRQMLFLESENNRLLQEKNKYFFESKNASEKLQMIVEKNDTLSFSFDALKNKYDLLEQKELALSSLLNTQSIDLQRMSKFYLKIKNVIKPYILNLKTKIAELTEVTQNQQTKMGELQTTLTETLTKFTNLQSDFEKSKKSYQFEKSDLIRSYEEQMHDLAKEVVEVKTVENETRSENHRLKKNLENKFALENELIKAKRDITELNEKNIQLESANTRNANLMTTLQNEASTAKQKLIQSESLQEQKTMTIESLRSQLAAKIDEVEKMSLRIKMFEKLNLNLSLSADNHRSEPTLGN